MWSLPLVFRLDVPTLTLPIQCDVIGSDVVSRHTNWYCWCVRIRCLFSVTSVEVTDWAWTDTLPSLWCRYATWHQWKWYAHKKHNGWWIQSTKGINSARQARDTRTDLNRPLLPGMRANTRYINSTKGTSSKWAVHVDGGRPYAYVYTGISS